MKRTADGIQYAKLSQDAKERHEQFLEYFGQDLMGFRNDALKQVYGQLERTSWEGLLPFDRDFYSHAATRMSSEEREISCKLTERVITSFMERLMTMLASAAPNQPLGEEYGVRYRLLAQIEHSPRETPTKRYRKPADSENVDVEDFEPVNPALDHETNDFGLVEQHDLTENGKLHFPEYWHRWMSRYESY